MKRGLCVGIVLSVVLLSWIHLAAPDWARAHGTDTKGSILLTIFLKHDQSKTLEQINSQLASTGFWKEFPPEGVEVVSWYVMMGIGQVVTLRVPAERLREVNLVIEKRAWGAYKTEFYPTYDFRPVWESNYQKK